MPDFEYNHKDNNHHTKRLNPSQSDGRALTNIRICEHSLPQSTVEQSTVEQSTVERAF